DPPWDEAERFNTDPGAIARPASYGLRYGLWRASDASPSRSCRSGRTRGKRIVDVTASRGPLVRNLVQPRSAARRDARGVINFPSPFPGPALSPLGRPRLNLLPF